MSLYYSSWKDKTFNQITTRIEKNNAYIGVNGGSTNLFKSRPNKIYRREIASSNNNNCNIRTSVKIDELNRPNGFLLYPSTINNDKGLVNFLDLQTPNSKYELSIPSCNTETACFNHQNNALRRVRSSGNIPKKFNLSKNNDSYYTNTNQYLKSRNKSFQQNQFNFIRQGDPTTKPGSNQSIQNIYSPQGESHCNKYEISSVIGNNFFQYLWIDSQFHNVIIPDGFYNIELLDTAFKNIMIQNKHYYVNNGSFSKVFLLNIAFNPQYNKIELQCFPSTIYHGSQYFSAPVGSNWDVQTTTPFITPGFNITNNISGVIGFTQGQYPSTATTTEQHFIANTTGKVFPSYSVVHYKPNNTQFAQQGAVSSSTLTARKDYDTITNTANSFRQPYGNQTASALAYSVSAGGFYTLKDKIGYPNKCTPKIMKDGSMRKCIGAQ